MQRGHRILPLEQESDPQRRLVDSRHAEIVRLQANPRKAGQASIGCHLATIETNAKPDAEIV